MMRKRRSTVYVRPGKDVTLYVPSDTPPEVCAYLNQLKADGVFSQGVMEILTQHIIGSESPPGEPLDPALDPAPNMRFDSPPNTHSRPDVVGGLATLGGSAAVGHPDVVGGPDDSHRLGSDQIFQQARRNAGKLSGSSEA
ncbi:hypothetical protein [Alicyclobacillus sp. ALC3]|uniref:hypothetical protein n=1 Tax=Alicyclobacillus sp. ALC3 TaxID=2796143 RepID=UPI0023785D4B|nr:hypothetical protein [Alicyclobacillus sp. ALC3]WDL95105.1 hypothetical protein JC200_11755 [Alicyclobacillus sp. ALC3]